MFLILCSGYEPNAEQGGERVALNLGGIIRLTYAVKNDVGALTNPATVVLAITQPDGTLAAGITVTLPPAVTGQLVYDFTPSQAGLHSVHWSTTVPTTAEDDMFVAERAGGLIISVDEAVAHLRAGGIITSDGDREQLQWLCLVVSGAVGRDLGRVIARRTVTEVYDGGRYAINLRSTPVVSIVSVTESGTLLAATDYTLNASAGMLYRGSTLVPWNFYWGRQNVVVVYVAGLAAVNTVEADDALRVVRKVALNGVQRAWQESQQAAHPLLEEFGPEAVAAAVGALTPLELGAYNSLRAVGIA
jgi:hypothetical protein